MMLRNKKTGEICDFLGTYSATPYFGISVDYHNGEPKSYEYNSLAEINEEWEDYTPKEPLIKDEKVRNLVRDWASINNVEQVRVMVCDYVNYIIIKFCSPSYYSVDIAYDGKGLKNDKTYTIAELCGEE